MKVNVLCDIIVYYVRVNQDKEVNMSNSVHPDVVGHIRVILERLDSIERIAARRYELALRTEQRVSIIETDLGHVESDVNDTDDCYADVVPRLDAIELEIEVMSKVVTENALTLCKIEERIAIMQEKIDGIN